MINTIASNINPETIQTIRTSPNHVMTRTAIHTCARMAQAVFAAGCFLAVMQIPYRILQILMGGFIIIQGPQMLFQAIPIVAYYDLAKVSSNIASIFKSRVVVQFAIDHSKSIPYGTQAAQFMDECEESFSLPSSLVKNLSNAEAIATALTHETIVAHNLNHVIATALKK
ncbi:MAG TPA: hypothetical protein VLE96_04265 [Chlamydiales bacterium]|nr:hypothetical protein [Chlamydiales bacterium]